MLKSTKIDRVKREVGTASFNYRPYKRTYRFGSIGDEHPYQNQPLLGHRPNTNMGHKHDKNLFSSLNQSIGLKNGQDLLKSFEHKHMSIEFNENPLEHLNDIRIHSPLNETMNLETTFLETDHSDAL